MTLCKEFEVGQHVTVSEEPVSEFCPGIRWDRFNGTDVTRDSDFPFNYPIPDMDIRGKEAVVVRPNSQLGGGRTIIEVEYEPGRRGEFLVPADILEP